MYIVQYMKFLINGGLIGLIAWGIQSCVFHLLGEKSGAAYALASLVTYGPLILLNFHIQRRMIFNASGRMWRFVIANVIIMLLVSAISPVCRQILAWACGQGVGDHVGFLAAALIGATPSFLLSRFFVFNRSAAGVAP